MKGPLLPIGVYGHAIINLGNEKIILIGGLTGPNLNQTLKQTFVYNHNQGVWSWGPALNQARFYHAVGIVTDEATQEKICCCYRREKPRYFEFNRNFDERNFFIR